nr:EOG090X0864 [Sida crystallina]
MRTEKTNHYLKDGRNSDGSLDLSHPQLPQFCLVFNPIYLTPSVHCIKVMMPDTKKIVEMMELRMGSSSSMQSDGVRMNGIKQIAKYFLREFLQDSIVIQYSDKFKLGSHLISWVQIHIYVCIAMLSTELRTIARMVYNCKIIKRNLDSRVSWKGRKLSDLMRCLGTVDLELSVASLIDGELDQEPGQFTDLDVNVALPHVQNVADPGKIYDNVVLGGTFDRLHAGHKMLLSAAILRCAKKLTIGVTDGPMIRSKKLFELIEPCQLRIEKLREFLEDIEPRICYNIVPIVDPYGPTGEDPDLQMLVVSEETLQGGHKVNNLRQERGLSVLDIHTIPLMEDAMATKHEENKISSSSARKRLLGTHIKPPKVGYLDYACGKGKPYIIGLTGGIASGKTSICARLKNLGVHSISCDHLGHQAYKKGTNCHRQMVEYFGDVILDDGGEIDRKKLGPVVFSDKAHLEKLNAMVWPEIRRLYLEEIETLKRQGFEGVIVLDAAILLEAGWDQDCNEVWVSIVPPSEAVQRIMERDKLSSEQATKRIESQLSNSERVLRANVVLCSVWEPEVTGQQVELAWRQVQRYLADSN